MPREINYKLGDHGETPIEVVGWIKKEVGKMKKKIDKKEFLAHAYAIAYNKAIKDVTEYLEKLLK